MEKNTVYTPQRVDKGWGFELIIRNEPEHNYCGKVLNIVRGKKTSWHYHLKKTETFYVQSGIIRLWYSDKSELKSAKSVMLFPGDCFHLPATTRHRLEAQENSQVLEVSTWHSDSGTIRIQKGD